MKIIIIIRILSELSLVFAVCFYFLSFAGETAITEMFYLAVCIMTYGAFRLGKSSKTRAYMLMCLFVAAFALAKAIADVVFITITISYSVYLAFKGLDETNYYLVIDRFNKGLVAVAAMFIIAVSTRSLDTIEAKAVPYMIIFVVTSVMLIRSLRLVHYNQNTDEINRINLRYSIAVVGLSFVLSLDQVRRFIVSMLLRLYDYILEVVIFILYGVFLAIGYGLKYAIAFVRSLLEGRKLKEQLDIKGSPFGKLEDLNTESLMESISRSWIYDIAVKVILSIIVLLAAYLVVKLLMRSFYNTKEEEEYTETREFIKRDEENKGSRRFAALFRPRSYSEYIRHYYQKFLKLCLDRKIDIRHSDTTIQISGKSAGEFDSEAVDKMRETYIKVRYGEDSVDKQTVKRFHDYYKQLKK